jgi:hypothetical protein
LSPEQFKYHVDDVQRTTHFAQWIADVLHNPLLARDVALEPNLRDQAHLVKTIRDHVSWLSNTGEQRIFVPN